MLANLVYNAALMLYEALPTEKEIKIALIKDIALIEEALKQPAMDSDRFESLMCMALDQLQTMANDQSALLDRIKSEGGLI